MVLVVAGAGAFAVMNPGVVKAFYEDIYPSDPAKRQALELCFMQDHKFNRIEADEREACYRRMLQPLGAISSAGAPPEPVNANPVDLQRAASQGNMPRNDIRRIEQNEHPPRAPH
jgi:hypothetical protein